MIHGSSAHHTSAVRRLRSGALAGVVAWSPRNCRGCASAGEVQISFGCQTLRKPIRQAIEISEAPMSTIQGLMKFEIRNCGIANETPRDQDRRPDLLHAAPAGEGPDQPERHDQREERQLPPDHRAEQEGIEAGDARRGPRSACRARRRRPARCWRSATGRRPRAARSRARSGSRR